MWEMLRDLCVSGFPDIPTEEMTENGSQMKRRYLMGEQLTGDRIPYGVRYNDFAQFGSEL